MTATDNPDADRRRPPIAIPETDVRPGETPAAHCPYCDRPFDAERARDLHLGEVHGDDLDGDERDAYEAAREAERDEVWLFHAKIVFALGATYSITVIVYMVVIQGGYL